MPRFKILGVVVDSADGNWSFHAGSPDYYQMGPGTTKSGTITFHLDATSTLQIGSGTYTQNGAGGLAVVLDGATMAADSPPVGFSPVTFINAEASISDVAGGPSTGLLTFDSESNASRDYATLDDNTHYTFIYNAVGTAFVEWNLGVSTTVKFFPSLSGVYGNYVTNAWYYNVTTNHYQYASSDPGTGWTPSTPTPVVSTVKVYSVSTVGVMSVLVAPARGCTGTPITITGSGFGDGATVTVGGVAATSVVVVDQTTITAVVGAHANGTVDVVVINDDGTTATSTNGYTYGTPWWIRTVGGVTSYSYGCTAPGTNTWTLITGVPTLAASAVSVTSLGALVTPALGCTGTTITITGTGFGASATVTAGGVSCTSVTVVNSTTITAVTGAHADGLVNVVVTNADGSTTTVTNGYTYATPWWVKTIEVVVDAVTYPFYSYVKACSPPDATLWALNTFTAAFPAPTGGGAPGSAPDWYGVDNDGWYTSTAAFGGSVGVSISNPAKPRTWTNIAAWATGTRGMLGGSPAGCCIYNNHLIYPATGYTVNTHYPPIRVFDGLTDHELCRLPPTTAGGVPQAVMSMIAANGTIYLSTFDSGTSSATWLGRVFSLDLDSGVLAILGSVFAAGELPYALAWHQGRLWCGTNNGIGTVGKVYSYRPGIDTAWSQDHATSVESAGGVTSMLDYQGKLYVGTDNAGGSRGKVLVRDSAGAYTTSDTGTGGTATINNGYLSMAVFGSNLYASYWNPDTPAVALIRTFDGSTWSTVYTGTSGTIRPFIALFVDNGVLYAAGGGNLLSAAILTTSNGTSWTDVSGQLPEATETLLPMVGTVVV